MGKLILRLAGCSKCGHIWIIRNGELKQCTKCHARIDNIKIAHYEFTFDGHTFMIYY
jgi:hypothetical protein